LAFVWFIWLTPLKHIYSGAWNRDHSKLRYWEEAQKTVRRVGVTHDVGIEMGRWGGKDWVAWIMNHIKPGQVIEGCEASHLGEALADMTNQQLEPKAEIWLSWWKTNQITIGMDSRRICPKGSHHSTTIDHKQHFGFVKTFTP